MEYRRFGSTKREVAVIGQGTWYNESDDRASAIAALRRGLDLGMTHIDTAEMYGSGTVEEIVAEAILGRRKATTPAHTAENAAAGDLRLTEGELARIDEAFPLGRRSGALPTL